MFTWRPERHVNVVCALGLDQMTTVKLLPAFDCLSCYFKTNLGWIVDFEQVSW